MPSITTDNVKTIAAILIPAITVAAYIVGVNTRQDENIRSNTNAINEIRQDLKDLKK